MNLCISNQTPNVYLDRHMRTVYSSDYHRKSSCSVKLLTKYKVL